MLNLHYIHTQICNMRMAWGIWDLDSKPIYTTHTPFFGGAIAILELNRTQIMSSIVTSTALYSIFNMGPFSFSFKPYDVAHTGDYRGCVIQGIVLLYSTIVTEFFNEESISIHIQLP